MPYRNSNAVTGLNKEESVHHALYPKANEAAIDGALKKDADMQDISSLILSLRKK